MPSAAEVLRGRAEMDEIEDVRNHEHVRVRFGEALDERENRR